MNMDTKKLYEKIRTKVNVEGCSLELMPRIKNGEVVPGTKVFRVYVTKKVAREELKRNEVVPKKVKGVETDIVELGKIRAYSTDRTQRIRSVPLAVSVANWNITAGSLGMHYKSPVGGPLIYAGANAHVLCDSPELPPEEIEERRICQPGPAHDDDKQNNIVGEYMWHDQIKPVTSSECSLSNFVLELLNQAAAYFGRNTRFYTTAVVTNHQDFAVYFPSESEQHVLEIPDASLEGKKFIGHLFAGGDTIGVICKVKYAIEEGFEPVIEPAEVEVGDTVWGASFWGDYETVVEDASAMIQVSYGDFVAMFEDVVLVKNEKVIRGGWSGSSWYKNSN